MLLTLVGSIFADNLTVSEIELKAGNSQDVAISLINASKKYTAFQFDIVLPEGISIAKNDKGKLMATLNADRIDDHTLTIQELGSNTYRFLCFSLTNAEFYGTSGALVNMTLQANEDVSAGVKEGIIESQVFTEIDGNQVKWDDTPFSISIELCIERKREHSLADIFIRYSLCDVIDKVKHEECQHTCDSRSHLVLCK